MPDFSPWQILQAVLPVYGLILLGGILRKTNILKPEGDASIMKLVINCLYPLLILDKILASDAVKDVKLVLWTLPTGFLIITLSIIISKTFATIGGIPKGEKRNTFMATCGIQNYGFAAVPIVMALFHEDLLGVQFVHSLGVEVALWTFGIAALQGKMPTDFKALLSAPILAVVAGLILIFTGIGDTITTNPIFTPCVTIMNWLGLCSFPMALMLIGATLTDEIKYALPTLRIGLLTTVVRLGILPALILLSVWLIPFPKDLATILIVQAAMPSAVMPIVLSRVYGGHPATAVQVVLTSQIVGIITIPIWIGLGLKLL